MGFLAGVVKEINRQEDAEIRSKEFMTELLERRKSVVLPQLRERREKLQARAEQRVGRVEYAQSFGLSDRAALALEMSGQLEFELAKLEKIGKSKVSENYIRSLDTAVLNKVDSDEDISRAIAVGLGRLKEDMSDSDSLTGIMDALNSTTMEELNEAIMGVTVTAPSLPKVPSLEYRPMAGQRIETSELSRMENQIASSLETTFGGGYKLMQEGDLSYIKFDDDNLNVLFTKLKDEAIKRAESAVPGTGVGSPADVSLFIGQTLQKARRKDESGQPVVAEPSAIYNNLDTILANPTTFEWETLPTQGVVVRDNNDTESAI